MKLISAFLFAFFIYTNVYAQFIVSGIVTDSLKNGIPNANITLVKRSNSSIIKFGFTDSKGTYYLNYNSPISDSIEVTASLFGYENSKVVFKLSEANKVVNFKLKTSSLKLPDVIVRNSAIYTRGDTLNYSVKAFQQKQDMVIADVLRKMPGIEVSSNGQVKYQGVPINKYYIEGLDMLDDKYAIANNNIPANAVDQVQILENHQPIKALDSFSISNRAAINIKLNNDAKQKFIGRAKAGIGIHPFSGDEEIVPMKFSKSQFLASYKYSNMGNDYSTELASMSEAINFDELKGNTNKTEYLFIPNISEPPIKKQRYLFNNINALSLNELVALKKDLKLKINLSYINDYQIQNSKIQTKYYFNTDTIKINELQKRANNFNLLNGTISLVLNTSKVFLTNNLKVIGNWNNSSAQIDAKNKSNQYLESPLYSISNYFNLIKNKNKFLFNLYSFISLSNTKQSLNITPDSLIYLPIDSTFYNSLIQRISLSTLYLNNYLAIGKRVGYFSFEVKTGTSLLYQTYYTKINAIQNGFDMELENPFKNKITGTQTNYYINNTINYSNNKFKINLNIPINITKNTFSKSQYHFDSIIYNTSINYNFISNYSLSNYFKLTGEFFRNQFINSPYYFTDSYVLSTYRNITNNNSNLFIIDRFQNTISINYKNTIKMFFANFGLNISKDKYNLIADQRFIADKSIINMIPLQNDLQTKKIFFNSSKYFYFIKSSLSGGIAYETTKSYNLLKNILQSRINNVFLFKGKISSKISKFSFDISLEFKKIISFQNLNDNSNVNFLTNHFETLYYYPWENSYFKLNSEQYFIKGTQSNSKNYYFSDLSFNHKFIKHKLVLEIEWQNVFNVHSFSSISVYGNNESISTYQIRPSQLSFKLNFIF